MDPIEYREKWRRRIADFQESGLSVPQWCATQKDATVPQVRYWKKKFEKETTSSLPASSPSSSWVQVDVGSEGAPAPSGSQALSIHINDITVDLQPGFDPDTLAEVVRVLKTW